MGETFNSVVGVADVFGSGRRDFEDDFEDEIRDVFGEEGGTQQQETLRSSAAPRLADYILTCDRQFATGLEYLSRGDRIKTPIGFAATIDAAIGMGIRPGEVFGLMARPGTGKTVAICNLAKNLGISCPDRLHVFFSMEQSGPEVWKRNCQLAYGMTRGQVEEAQGALDPDGYAKYFRNLVIVDRGSLSLAQMAEELTKIQAALQLPIGMVSIDYLGLIATGGGGSRYEKVSENAVGCKALARTFTCGVFVAIQVSRQGGGDGTQQVAMGAARDSGVIEEACDYLSGLWRNGDQLSMALLKNRHGPLVDSFPVYFDKATLELRDYA